MLVAITIYRAVRDKKAMGIVDLTQVPKVYRQGAPYVRFWPKAAGRELDVRAGNVDRVTDEVCKSVGGGRLDHRTRCERIALIDAQAAERLCSGLSMTDTAYICRLLMRGAY